MAATANWFGLALKGQWSSTAAQRVDFLTDTIKCSLHTSTYVPNQDTNQFWSDTSNEVTSTNYTTGGLTLTSKTLTYDSATNETRLDAADPAWTAVTFTARIAVFYKDTGVTTTAPLIAWHNFGADQTVSGANFTIVLDATGLAKIVAS